MRRALAALLLLTTGAAHAVVEGDRATPTWPSRETCEGDLRRAPPVDDETRAAGEEFLSWISMRHPVVADVVDRTGDLDLAFDLFYLTSGYHLPPSTWKGPGRGNRPYEHWLRTLFARYVDSITFAGRDRIEIARLVKTGWTANTVASRFLGVVRGGEHLPAAEVLRRSRIWSMLSHAYGLLGDLVDPRHHVLDAARDRIGVEFQSLFLPPQVVVDFPSIRVQLNSAFNAEEMRDLRRMHRSLENDGVRVWIAHALDERFEEIDSEHRALRFRLACCTDVDSFRRAYRAVKAGHAPAPAPLGADRLRPEFDSRAIADFLDARPVFSPAGLDAASSFGLVTDLNRAADLLGQALLQLEMWRGDRFEWSFWAEELAPTSASVRRLRFDLGRRSREIAGARAEFERASKEILRLADWVDRTGAALRSMDTSEASLAALEPRVQMSLRAALVALPALVGLMDRAVRSIESRSAVMIEETTALTNLLLLVADLAESRVRRPTDGEGFADSEKFERILRLMKEMARYRADGNASR